MAMDKRTENLVVALLFLGFAQIYIATAPFSIPLAYDDGVMLRVSLGFWKALTGAQSAGDIAFSKFGLGQSLIILAAAPAYLRASSAQHIGEYVPYLLSCYLPPVFIGSSIVALTFKLCLRYGHGPQVSAGAAIATGAGTMIWPYSHTFFSESTIALCLLAAVYFAKTGDEPRRPHWLNGALAGTALGWVMLTKISYAPAALFIAIYYFHREWASSRRRVFPSAAAFLAPVAALMALALYYNHIRFGHGFHFGYGADIPRGAFISNDNSGRDMIFGFNSPLFFGLYGLTLGSGKSFFLYNPFLILALWGIRGFYRQHRADAILFGSITASVLITFSMWWAWHGDVAWGPRFLLPLAPFMSLVAAGAVRDAANAVTGRWRIAYAAAGLVLVSISAAVQIAGVWVPLESFKRIAAKSAPSMRPPVYNPNGWTIVDDGVMEHYLPQFSPVTGNMWMMRLLGQQNGPGLDDVLANPPWISLNPGWTVKKSDLTPDLLKYKIWWMEIDRRFPEIASVYKGMAFSLIISAFSLLGLALHYSTPREPEQKISA